MELRYITSTYPARLVSGVAAIALVLVAVIMLAGPAQAGLAASRGDGHARAVKAPHSSTVVNQGPASVQRHLDLLARQDRFENRAAARPHPAHPSPPKDANTPTEVRNAAGETLPVTDDACTQNLALAASRELRLPDGWEMHCVGPGLDWEGGSHWGVTCPYTDCPEGTGPYVSISNPTYYVVAHELCHANFGTDELMADACAADHGASLETSPYN